MAQILKDQYIYVFFTPTNELVKIKLNYYLHTPIFSLNTLEKEIIDVINNISSFYVAGLKGIPAQIHKDYASVLSL